MARIYPVIMSGGAGSRLWPMSRNANPKQLLPLVTSKTMIQETVARFDSEAFADPVFVCNARHEAAIIDQMSEIGQPVEAIIIEPVGRNTAPCAIVAAEYVKAQDPEALVLLVPADHHVTRPDKFRESVHLATQAAQDGRIVTFGISPDKPETGYGYIERGAEIYTGAYNVAAFREKPNAATAQEYLDTGNYAWNAGLFLFSPAALLEDAQNFVPDMHKAANRSLAKAPRTGVSIALDPDEFAGCPADSIDYAIMERTTRAAVVPCDIGWNDIGSFASLLNSREQDESHNALRGDVLTVNARNILVDSDGPTVAVVGLDNIGVIVKDGKILVTDLNASQDVKKIVTTLKSDGRQSDL